MLWRCDKDKPCVKYCESQQKYKCGIWRKDRMEKALKILKFNVENGIGYEKEQLEAIEEIEQLNKTCEICIHKANKENYDLECCECSRFYADRFEEVK